MRSRKALANIVFSLMYQLVAICCGLVVPRIIINTFGSSTNGLLSSITRFLGFIVLLEGGVGGVVRAALYGPLAGRDYYSVSRIMKATERFFRSIGLVFLAYLLVIACTLPFVTNIDSGFFYTFSLVLIIGASTFFQYCFGISNFILLQADQRQYVTHCIQIFTVSINAVLVVFLTKLGFGIHVVQLASSVIYILRPILVTLFVKRKYDLQCDVEPDDEAISQRWHGLGHHLAYLLHHNADITLLTLFADLKDVSVYAVYNLVVSSLRQLVSTCFTSLEASFGNMIAKKETSTLEKTSVHLSFLCLQLLPFCLQVLRFSSYRSYRCTQEALMTLIIGALFSVA